MVKHLVEYFHDIERFNHHDHVSLQYNNNQLNLYYLRFTKDI